VKGHYASQCPKRAQVERGNLGEEAGVNATWEVEQVANMFVSIKEHFVHNAVGPETGLAMKEVLLDNQADISIMHPSMLSDVREIDSKIKVKGVGGFQMVVKEKGSLKDFFEVYASSETKANVLSFAEVEDKYPISYIPQSGFIVHLQDRDLHFRRKGKLYVADWNECTVLNTTKTITGTSIYTKEEVKRAKEAQEFIKNSGYPSLSEARHLIIDGNIKNSPELTAADFEKA